METEMTFTELFKDICSLEQMELCQKFGILSKSEQQQLCQLEQSFLDNKDKNYKKIMEWVLKLKERYNAQLKSQSIQKHNHDLDRIQYLDQIQYLSSLLEEYGETHQDLSDLIQALRKLRIEWKHRKKDIENIILSILASSPQKNKSFRVIKITRSNLQMLGLGLGSIGKHYIVFEESTTEDDRKDILNQIAQDFSLVFQENAAQNFTRMADTYPRIFQDQEVDVLNELKTLSQKLYLSNPASMFYPASLPSSSYIESRKSVLSKSSRTMFNVADPRFEPAEWDWSPILKYKRPRARPGNWCSRPSHQGLWSTSISRLADQFTQVAESYYANMLNNARLMFAQRSHMYEFATDSLLKIYRAIQLEKGCANLNKSLPLLYDLCK